MYVVMSYQEQQLLKMDVAEREADKPNPSYHLARAFNVDGTLFITALTAAFRHAINTTPNLRARFVKEGGTWHKEILTPKEINFTIEELEAADTKSAQALAMQKQNEIFDLSRGPLFRVSRICYRNERGENKQILVTAIHHLLADGLSTGIIYTLASYKYNFIWWMHLLTFRLFINSPRFNQSLASTAGAFLPGGFFWPQRDYMDYARAQREQMRAIEDDTPQTPGTPLLQHFATKRSPCEPAIPECFIGDGDKKDTRVETFSVDLNPEELTAVKALAAHHRTSINRILLAIYYRALHEALNHGNFSVRMLEGGRETAHEKYALGYFARDVEISPVTTGQESLSVLLRLISEERRAHRDLGTTSHSHAATRLQRGLPKFGYNYLPGALRFKLPGTTITSDDNLQPGDMKRTWYGDGFFEEKFSLFVGHPNEDKVTLQFFARACLKPEFMEFIYKKMQTQLRNEYAACLASRATAPPTTAASPHTLWQRRHARMFAGAAALAAAGCALAARR